jgi:hypothetical protein
MYQLLYLEGAPSSKVVLTEEFRADVKWWCNFLRTWNGISLIPKGEHDEAFTDASKPGFGAWWRQGKLWGHWSHKESLRHSNWRELQTILIAIRHWKEEWRGKRITIFSDNMASVSICRKGYTRSPKLAKIMRDLFWVAASHDIDLTVTHIPGDLNFFADFLSRQFTPGTGSSQRVIYASTKLKRQAPDAPTLQESVNFLNWQASLMSPPE